MSNNFPQSILPTNILLIFQYRNFLSNFTSKFQVSDRIKFRNISHSYFSYLKIVEQAIGRAILIAESENEGAGRREGDRDPRVAEVRQLRDTLSDPFTRIFIRNCER